MEIREMKENSCLFHATNTVIRYQFGLRANAERFDELNDGRGIPLEKIPFVIAQILPFGVEIDTIYVCGKVAFEGGYNYVNTEKVRDTIVSSPNVALVDDDHAAAVIPGNLVSSSAAITFRERNNGES
jgi:hypothetical protein